MSEACSLFPFPASLPLTSARCARVPPWDPGNPYICSAGEILQNDQKRLGTSVPKTQSNNRVHLVEARYISCARAPAGTIRPIGIPKTSL